MTGSAVQWLRDGLGIIATAAETEPLARSVPDAGGVYFVPAFSGLFAPHWDMTARGTIVGLTRFATRAHLVRATLEAIAFQSREVLEAMASARPIVCTNIEGYASVVGNDNARMVPPGCKSPPPPFRAAVWSPP